MLLSSKREDTYIATVLQYVLLNTLTQGYAVLPDKPVLNQVAIWTAGISGKYGNRIACTTSSICFI